MRCTEQYGYLTDTQEESRMFDYPEGSIESLFQIKSLQAIVDNVGSLIQRDMVISNKNGVIVAATRRDRIGVTNQEVKRMLETNGNYHIVEKASDDSFFRPGINLPIRYENTPVGAVGITGKPSEVKEFSRLVQAMVQQQLYDIQYQVSVNERKRIISDFVYCWIYKGTYQDADEFAARSKALGLDINIPRVICLIDCCICEELNHTSSPDQTNDRIHQFVETRLKQREGKHVVTMLSNRITVLLDTSSTDAARRIMTDLQNEIEQYFGVICAIGISSPFQNFIDAKSHYDVARIACNASVRRLEEYKEKNICAFGSYDLEPLVSTLSREDKSRLLDHFFRNYKTPEAIEETVQLLEQYIDCNRSISEVALRLNMHKNTVQCRLDRIFDLTGMNPRNMKDLAYMFIIILIYKFNAGHESDQ